MTQLSINVKKTKLIILKPRQKTLPLTRQIIIENDVLEQVRNTKFLGIYVDQQLTWKDFIVANISESPRFLYKTKC